MTVLAFSLPDAALVALGRIGWWGLGLAGLLVAWTAAAWALRGTTLLRFRSVHARAAARATGRSRLATDRLLRARGWTAARRDQCLVKLWPLDPDARELAAALMGAPLALGVPCDADPDAQWEIEYAWVKALAGPRRDGAPMAAFEPLLVEPGAGAAWLDLVGGAEAGLLVVQVGMDPVEAAELARAGSLTVEGLRLIAALN